MVLAGSVGGVMNLDGLNRKLEPVTFPARLGGESYEVIPADGYLVELLAKYQESEETKEGSGAPLLWQMASRCVPSAAPEKVKALTAAEAWALVLYATAAKRAVEAEHAGDPPTPAGSTPSPATASGPSAGA